MTKTITKTEERIIADIESGKYRDYYLIYNRKSTDDDDSQKNSITYQRAENVRTSKNRQLLLAPLSLKGFCANGQVSERHTAFKEDENLTISDTGVVQYQIERPKFQRLLYFLSKGYFKGVIGLCWDRVSRNKGDEKAIRYLMQKGVDFHFTLTTYDDSSSGELHMDIDGMFAIHHSRVTSEKVTINARNLRDRGVCTYKAPMGYLNEGKMEDKPFDPEREPIIREVAKKYDEEGWGLTDLAKWANEQGLTTTPSRRRRTEEEMLAEEEVKIEKVSRPINPSHIHRIFSNRFYTGKIQNSQGEWIPSVSHKAIIPEDRFERIQKKLHKKNVSIHYTEKLDHPLRGRVRCTLCGRVYTPYTKKGILYFNARCVPDCTNTHKNFNFDFITTEVGKFIANLSFTNDELDEIDARTGTEIALFEERRSRELAQNERKKKKLREDLAYIRSNKLTLLKSGVYTPETLLDEENKLNDKLLALQDEEQASDVAMHEVVKDVFKLSELLKNTKVYYDFATPQEKEKIINIIFSELSLSDNTLQYSCTNGFKPFEDRLFAVGEQRVFIHFYNRVKRNP